VVRGEMPIEPGASWFSPKCVEAQRLRFKSGGKALFRCGLRKRYQIETNSEYQMYTQPVRRWGISFIVERETAQTTS
jgi:hypothetical protein